MKQNTCLVGELCVTTHTDNLSVTQEFLECFKLLFHKSSCWYKEDHFRLILDVGGFEVVLKQEW